MEKFIRVSDINKDHAPVYTAEEIANSFRGVGVWVKNGDKWDCGHCGCTSRDRSEFCKFCGSLNGR